MNNKSLPKESYLQSIGSSIFWKSLSTVMGLLKHIIIAAAIGLSAQLDVFYLASALISVLVFSWAGMFDIITVPNMVKFLHEGKHDSFKELSSGIFILSMAAGCFLAITIFLLIDIIALVAIGFQEERMSLFKNSLFWLMPVVIFYLPFRSLISILRSQRQFSNIYQGEFIIGFTILICVFFFKNENFVLFWSFSIAVICALIYLLSRTWRFLIPFKNPLSKVVLQSLTTAPGLLLLIGAQYIFVFTDRIFVSYLPIGAISALAYGYILATILPNILSLSGGFITVILEDKLDSNNKSTKIDNLITIAIISSAAITSFLLISGASLIQIIFERGAFTSTDTTNVGIAKSAFALMILPAMLIAPIAQIFIVENRISFMVWRVIAGLVCNIILNSWFLFILEWSVFGIALATSISQWVMLALSLMGLIKLEYNITWRKHLIWMASQAFLSVFILSFFKLILHMNDGIFLLLTSTSIICASFLLLGCFYTGSESELIRSILWRCIPNWIKRTGWIRL